MTVIIQNLREQVVVSVFYNFSQCVWRMRVRIECLVE